MVVLVARRCQFIGGAVAAVPWDCSIVMAVMLIVMIVLIVTVLLIVLIMVMM